MKFEGNHIRFRIGRKKIPPANSFLNIFLFSEGFFCSVLLDV